MKCDIIFKFKEGFVMLKHKIGDYVTIKANLFTEHSYFTITDEMISYQEKVARIVSFAERDIFETEPERIVGYKLDIDNGKYGWEDSMFEN